MGQTLYSSIYAGNKNIEFNNILFHKLSKLDENANWVDIEIFYYSELKKLLNRGNSDTSEIRQLNTDLLKVIRYFDKYLFQKVISNSKSALIPKIRDLFINTVNPQIFEVFKKEFAGNYESKLHRSYINEKWVSNFDQPKFRNTQVLNFNYTNTISNYFDFSKNDVELVNIHGEVGSNMHPINMGFGDEIDEFYRKIEDSGENECLRFVKSFYYSNNSHYKRLLDFLEMDDFQCQIMGHSCGLSDRTLLKTIFEHQKCKSIKPFYYAYDKENEWHEKDNYLEIVKNISRHFSDKKMMREKVVNKEFCLPLPQVKRKSVE